MVNRQLRRAEEKKERKAEKEKERAKAEKAERRQKRREARKARAARRAAGGAAKGETGKGGEAKGETHDAARPARRSGTPGRFSGILMSATLFFIALQAVAPPSDDGLVADVVSASFYLLYGYFATLWMMRREAPRARFVVVLGGALMALMTLGVQTFSPDLEIAVRMVALAIPLTLAGAYLGQLVWDKAP